MLPSPRTRSPCIGLALAAVLGIALADRLALNAAASVGATLLLGAAAFAWRRTVLCLAFVAVAFATLHTVRHRLSPVFAGGPRVASVEGIVVSDPEPLPFFARGQTGTFRLRATRPADAQLIVTWCGPLPRYGDRIAASGSLIALEAPRNPGQFDFATHLRRSGVLAGFETRFPADCRILAHHEGSAAMAFAIHARRWMQAQLALDLGDSPEIATLIASMVLGMRGDTPEEMQDLFRTTGTLHLFAVSGLNIAMLAIIAAAVLRPLGIGRRALPLAIIPVLIFYALTTGLSASCVRATIMAAALLFGDVIERRAPVFNNLAAAAALILAWDTNQLFVPGFQFSFVLVLTIVWLADRISRALAPLGMPDRFLPRPLWTPRQRAIAAGSRILAASAGVTLSAWLGSLAFTAGYFHLFSASAIAANMIAVPLAFAVLALGLATVLSALVWKPLAVLFTNANWACAKLLLATVKAFALLPGGHVYVELPRIDPAPACELTALDLGEGAAIHLRSGDTDWLIDTGASWRYIGTTLPYLRSRGVDALDALVLTHGDSHHIGAAASLIDELTPRTIYDHPLRDRSSTRRQLHTWLAAQQRGKSSLQRGDTLPCGSASVRVLYPPAGERRMNADDQALVLRIECEGVRVLLMSDAGFTTESWLLANEPDLRADILVKGHHARDLSGTADFLAHVHPAAIIVGALGYGEAPTALDPWCTAATARGTTVFRQDECGAVTITIRDRTADLRAFANAQSARFTAPR